MEETLSKACSLVHSLEITQEPYLTHSSRAAFTESPGLLVTLLEEVAGPSPVGRAGPQLASAWGGHLPVAHREMCLHTGSCALFLLQEVKLERAEVPP